MLADKLLDTANVAVGAMTFGQALADDRSRLRSQGLEPRSGLLES